MAGPRPASRLKSRNKNQRKGGKSENDGSNSNGNDGTKQDEAVLKKPIETSVIGLIRALKVLENGTAEVRDYLSNECDVIYECRVCRSLFRSLANFILHKRVYCQDSYESTFNRDRRSQEDEQLFIQSETELKQEDDTQETDKKPKDLSSIIDRLGRKIDTNPFPTTNTKLSDLPITSDEDNIKNVLSLQTVEGTASGMFQTISENSYENDMEFMKTEVMELHMMENDGGAVIGPDGRCLGFRTSTKSPNTVYNDFKTDFMNEDSYNGKLECEKCNQKFSTRKTLRFHLNTKHSENRLVYPCPDCAETFVNPWGVYRHLFKVHRKTSREVRKLRGTVQNSSYQMDQAPIRKIKPDTNTEIVLSEQERLNKNNEEWMENLECDNDLQCCGGCGRRFERKAALHSHSLMCQKRIAACNKIKRSATQSDDKSSSAKSKTVVKKNVIAKKKSNNEDTTPEKSSYDVTPDESRSSSRAEIITENMFIEKEVLASKNSSNINSNPLKVILSDDDSLEEVPVKDPLEVSDTEETPPIIPTTSSETTVNRILFNDVTSTDKITDTPLPTDQQKLEKDCSTTSITDKDIPLENTNDDHSKVIGPAFINDMLAVRMKAFTNVGRKFVCMPCDYRYSSLASLRRHMAIHFNWKRFRCLRCDFMCFDKREAIVHAQTTHHATLDVIKKFVTRMPETESDSYSSKVFLPLNTTPQEIITLDDSDDDSTKHENQNMEDAKSTTSSTVATNDEDSNVPNEFSRNLIMEMIIGNSEPSQKINISSSSIESNNSTSDLLSSVNTVEIDPLPPTPTIVECTSKISTDLIVETKLSNETIEKLSNEIIISCAPSTSSTDDSIKTSSNISSSRPVRNRVKPVNKDFIYDMSALTNDVEDFTYTTKSKRKTDCDIKDIEPNKFTLDTSDTVITSASKAKKRRRNSKVYTSSNCSNSSNNSWESNENVRIVPIIDYTQISSSNFIRKPEEIITNDRNDLLITPTTTHLSQSEKTSIVTTNSASDSEQTPVTSEFMIHSVMSVNT